MTSVPAPTDPAALPSGAAPWVCPFCALHCDSLALGRDSAGGWQLQGSDCPRAVRALQWFPPGPAADTCQIDGQPAPRADALDAAADRLRTSRQPLFGGLATDVAGLRALYVLANRCAAILDHAHGDAMLHSLRALQDRGAFTTTLAEIRAHADLMVCVGTQTSLTHPEFYRRCGLTGPRDAGPCELVFLGCEADPGALSGTVGTVGTVVPSGDLHDTLATLNALCRPRPLANDGFAPPALRHLAQRLRAARYAVLVWSPSSFGKLAGPHAALLAESLSLLAKTLNLTTRAATFALSGDDGGQTALQTLTWLSGLPPRTGVLRSGLRHDPHRYATAKLLADGAVDLLLWVSSFGPDLPPPSCHVPTITLGHPALATGARSAPGVFIPVSTPGIGSAGHLFRLDGGVVLPLQRMRDDGLPTVADIARELAARLPAEATP